MDTKESLADIAEGQKLTCRLKNPHWHKAEFHDLVEEGVRWQEALFLKLGGSRPDDDQGWTGACLHKNKNKNRRPKNKQTNKNLLHQKPCTE